MNDQKKVIWGWRDSSEGKSTDCFSLAKDAALVSSTKIRWLTTIYNSSSRGSNNLFCHPRIPDTHVVHVPTCRQNIHAHIQTMF